MGQSAHFEESSHPAPMNQSVNNNQSAHSAPLNQPDSPAPMNQPVNNNQPGRSAPLNQPVNNSLRGHPTSTSRRPRLVRRNAEEHVALTLRAQRARYDAMMAERDIEYPTMALRSFSNTDAPQVTRDAQTVEVIHAVEITQTVEVTNAPQTAEAGLNSLTGNILTTTTSSTSTISSVVVVNAQVFSAPASPSSSIGGSPVTMRENSHDQQNSHAIVDQVTSSSSDADMSEKDVVMATSNF
ncbi:hypothetical protein BTUL_0458g00010 [Botrytis tulipae]|uniref:Uncharacterized protein n=1 Tax=Botrytis tulipae TaxID=87230 RepID=A0A4Z1E495_9HELO|nr:hypothetical protein BTUL_0458g00010 [Botrytis tulipae]